MGTRIPLSPFEVGTRVVKRLLLIQVLGYDEEITFMTLAQIDEELELGN